MVPHAPGDSSIWDEESTLWNARSGKGRVNVNSSRLCIVTQRERGSDLGFLVNHHNEPVLPCSRPSHWGGYIPYLRELVALPTTVAKSQMVDSIV